MEIGIPQIDHSKSVVMSQSLWVQMSTCLCILWSASCFAPAFAAPAQALQMTQEPVVDALDTDTNPQPVFRSQGTYKGMVFGYEVTQSAYQSCGKAYTLMHGKENFIWGCTFTFKLNQGHLEIEEFSKAAGSCGVCSPTKIYRVKDSGVIYLRHISRPKAKHCQEVKTTCG